MSFDPDAFIASGGGTQTVAANPVPNAVQQPQGGAPEGFDPDQFLEEQDQEKYGTPSQQAITGVEGLASGVISKPGVALVEKMYGLRPEEGMAGRERANPITHGLGEATGLVGGAMTGVGEGAVMAKAGELGAEAVGLGSKAVEGASLIHRVGSEAVKQAAEMAVLQSGDEAAKMIMQDPDASAQSAIANVGLAAALGGGTGAIFAGAVSPLWKATIGDRTERFLGDLVAKMGGKEGAESTAEALSAQTGLEIPDALKAKIDNRPGADLSFSTLTQHDTTAAGRKLQGELKDFTQASGDKMAETLGVSPEHVRDLPDLDKYTSGGKLADTLHESLKQEVEPIADAYEATKAQFKAAPLSPENLSKTAEDIAKKSLDEGWHKAESDAQVNLMDRVLEKLPKQETADDLKNFITNLRNSHPYGSPTYGAAKDIVKSLEEAQGRAITDGIRASGGTAEEIEGALKSYDALKGRYRGLMTKLDALDEHLHLGKWDGPKTFLKAVKEMGSANGEAVLNRLSGANKAQALELLAQVSPETLAQVRQHHLDTLLRASVDDGKISPYKLLTKMDKLSPQIKGLIATPEQQAKLEAVGQIMERLKDTTYNHSKTARTVDKLMHGNVNPLVMIAGLVGHGGSAVLAHVGALGFTEGRDALKLGMMKFMGSNQPVKAEGFKAMVDFMHNTVKGQNVLAKGAKAVFKAGVQVIEKDAKPDVKDRDKLDKAVDRIQSHPDKFAMSQDGDVGHYMPEHQVALTKASTQAVQYLGQLKPRPFKPSPLDAEIQPSSIEMARYHRALDIAQEPAIVLQHIKDGTLQTSDIQDLDGMYPALRAQMASQLTNAMVGKVDDGEIIPYKTKVSLSLFLGQPLDSSMTPSSIIAAQPVPKPEQQPQAGEKTGKISNKAGTEMMKGANAYQTADQSAAANRGSRKS